MSKMRMAHQHLRLLLFVWFGATDGVSRFQAPDGSWVATVSLPKLAKKMTLGRDRLIEQFERLVILGAVTILRVEGGTLHARLEPPRAVGAPTPHPGAADALDALCRVPGSRSPDGVS